MIFLKEIMEQAGVSVIDRSHLRGVKSEMRGRKLRSVAYCKGC